MASTRIVGKDAVFKVAADTGAVVDISADGNEITLNLELNNEDGTGFGVSWREFTLIDGTFSIDYASWYATGTGVIDEVLMGGPTMATLFAKRLFEFHPNGVGPSATKPKYSGSVFLASAPISANRSGITTMRARFSGASQLARAVA